MPSLLKKILVVFPVVLLGIFFFYDNGNSYAALKGKRLLVLWLTIVALYSWIITDASRRRQPGFFAIAVQASFYLYIFMVLTLTGYFILSKQVDADWWTHMTDRIRQRDHVNLELFRIFRIYTIGHRQILGNLLLLFPLGIYLPLLYPRLSGWFVAFVVFICIALAIELLQLATRYRSADVDDVLLNVTGAVAGYIVFRVLSLKVLRGRAGSKTGEFGLLA